MAENPKASLVSTIAPLCALIIVPLIVWLLPASRMPVFVEELPADAGLELSPLLVLLGVWLAGVVWSGAHLTMNIRRARRVEGMLPAIDDERLRGPRNIG